jgi:hypothetical protein
MMKIINGIQLADMPNGTVFSDITDSHFDPNGSNGDMTINGLHIMCGHDDKYCPVGSGRFNGVLHMIDYVTYYKTETEISGRYDEELWNKTTDTDSNDYDKNDWVVVYNKEEVRAMIRNLTWVLTGCSGRLKL